jgi:hypothetical protein
MTEKVPADDEGGESSCFAHLICPECGIVLDGSAHSKECTWVTTSSDVVETDTTASESND